MSSSNRWKSKIRALLTLGLLFPALQLSAQYPRPVITRGVDLKQKLNGQIPLDLVFQDEKGQAMPLRSYFGDKPVILSLVYFRCQSVCPITIRETIRSMNRLPLTPGKDYNVLIVSFDPKDKVEGAVDQKAMYAADFHKSGFGDGVHFLTGSQEAIAQLTDAVGWKYNYDERTKQFAHAAGIMVATPDGKLSRYFYGIAYASADIRMALIEASKYKIASPADYILMFCFHYDESQGKYTLAITNILKLAGGLTVVGLIGMICVFIRKEKKEQSQMTWKKVPHVG